MKIHTAKARKRRTCGSCGGHILVDDPYVWFHAEGEKQIRCDHPDCAPSVNRAKMKTHESDNWIEFLGWLPELRNLGRHFKVRYVRIEVDGEAGGSAFIYERDDENPEKDVVGKQK